MTRGALQRLQELFDAVADLRAEDRVAHYEAHEVDPALREQVEALLDEPPDDFLGRPILEQSSRREVELRGQLTDLERELERRTTLPPTTEAPLRLQLGVVHRLLGNAAQAETHLTRGLELTPESNAVAEYEHHLALALAGRADFEAATVRLEAALERDPPAEDRVELAHTRALVVAAQGDLDTACATLESLYAEQKRRRGVENRLTLTIANSLAQLRLRRGELEAADELFTASIADIRESSLASTPLAATLLAGAGRVALLAGRPDDAERAHREAYRLSVETLGDDHPATQRRRRSLTEVRSAS